MTCTLERPTQQELFDYVKDTFQTIVLGGADVIPETNEWYVVAVDYALMEQFYALSEQMWRERDPRKACCDNLLDMAALNGVYPKPASFAVGFATITGVAGASLVGFPTITFDGDQYDVISILPTVMPPSGSLTVRVQSQILGEDGNKDSTITTGTLTSPLTDINSVVEVGGGLFCNGSEEETCEKFRVRYLERLTYQPVMNFSRIQRVVLDEWPCTTRVFNKIACCGSVDDCGCTECQQSLSLYVMFDGTFDCGIAPDECVAELNTYLFGEHPGHGEGVVDIGICGSVEPVVAALINVEVFGADCATQNQRNNINDLIFDYFLTLSPGMTVSSGMIRFAIGQVLGTPQNLTVKLSLDASVVTNAGTMRDACGDFITTCTHIPCVGDIGYQTDVQVLSECS